MARRPPLEIVDTSSLTDADWAEIHKLQRAYQHGEKAFSKTLYELGEADPIRLMTVMSAFWPEVVRETMKDQMAAEGVTVDDLKRLIRELERKLESPYREQ
jgi:hypothetical protein